MRCVERTYEYLDGLALVALLRANELDAHLFDENFVRQDWLHIIVYGGFRVMVPENELERALQLRDSSHNGVLSLTTDECTDPICPACQESSGHTDLAPRRRVFAAFITTYFFYGIQIGFEIGGLPLLFASVLAFTLFTLMPNLLRHFLVGRYRCSSCLHAWKAPPDRPFFEQQLQAEAALNPSS